MLEHFERSSVIETHNEIMFDCYLGLPQTMYLLYIYKQYWCTVVVGCCLATKSLNLSNRKWSGSGSGLLGVTSNKQFTVLRLNSMSLEQPRPRQGNSLGMRYNF